MLYNQPLSVRFGTELVRQIESTWSSIDIAVAWARRSGMAYLVEPLEKHLRSGGRLSAIVGVDLQNTTYEGLLALLQLEAFGDAETFVYHNEAGSTFHPKLYLFRNAEQARLIVGSNNITQSGLFVNVEAGLQIDAPVSSTVVTDALDALASWKDIASGLVRRLDHAVLDDLRSKGYVPDEKTAAEESQRRRRDRRSRGAPLFGSRTYSPPGLPRAGAVEPRRRRPATRGRATTAAPAGTSTTATGSTLLMRLRKAHVEDRPTQTQIPIRVVEAFFHGTETVRSVHTGDEHQTRTAQARGGPNTVKLEIPEMRYFNEPLARFEKSPTGISYEVYDANSPQGKQIKAALEAGRRDGTTTLTLPQNPESSTWWRFI